VVEPNGDVIGTAMFGGTDQKGKGVVFKATPPNKKNPDWRYKVIYKFPGGEGATSAPYNGVTLGNDGVLYGMSQLGGTSDCGFVYQLTPPASSSTGAWEETTLYNFGGQYGPDGCEPYNGQLLFDATTGSLYGTTMYGGIPSSLGYGTLFRLDPPAQAGDPWTETVLHAFSGASDGANPTGGLGGYPDGGIIYGTAQSGGGSANAGVVWGYNTATGTVTAVYTFLGGSDGASPEGGVTGPFSYGAESNEYFLLGTTVGGGSTNCVNGCGTVYVITLPILGPVTKSILHTFLGTDGAYPAPNLAWIGGGHWGTTGDGGSGGGGTLFEIQVSGITHLTLSYVPVYTFLGGTTDGAGPSTGLAGDSGQCLRNDDRRRYGGCRDVVRIHSVTHPPRWGGGQRRHPFGPFGWTSSLVRAAEIEQIVQVRDRR
jgi:uncharacterized repeat protein (TIGR03803 family)